MPEGLRPKSDDIDEQLGPVRLTEEHFSGDKERNAGMIAERQRLIESIAEGRAEVTAVSKFTRAGEVAKYFYEQDSLDFDYKKRLKEQHGILFDESDDRLRWQFVQIGEKRIYNWQFMVHLAKTGDLPSTEEIAELKERLDKDSALGLLSRHFNELLTDNWRNISSLESVGGLSKDVLDLLSQYDQWEGSDTGQYLDGAVASGQIAQEKADEIRKAKEEGKAIITNARQFGSDFKQDPDGWEERQQQLYWIIAETENDQHGEGGQ